MKTQVLILLMVFLAGCNPVNRPLSESRKQAILNEAQAVVKEMNAAFAVPDFDKIPEFLDPGPDCMMIVNNHLFTGLNADTLRKRLGGLERQTYDTKSEKYIIVNETCFMYIWNGAHYHIMKTGDTTGYDNYFISFTFRKVGGKWKFLAGHESFEAPAALTAIGSQ